MPNKLSVFSYMNEATNVSMSEPAAVTLASAASAVVERRDPGPPPIQFRLKTLLAATAALCVVFAIAGRISGVWLAALIWFLLLVAAHVAASAMGTRATAHAPSRYRIGADRPTSHAEGDPRGACAPTTRLGGSGSLGSVTWFVTVAGAIIGCVVGTVLVSLHNGGWRGWPALVLSAASSSGVGAFLSFLAASCAKVAGRAWREASHQSNSRR